MAKGVVKNLQKTCPRVNGDEEKKFLQDNTIGQLVYCDFLWFFVMSFVCASFFLEFPELVGRHHQQLPELHQV